MRKRRASWLGAVAAAAMLPVLTPSPAHAGPGYWDPVGTREMTYNSTYRYHQSVGWVESSGGDFLVLNRYTVGRMWTLKEYDPGDNLDEVVDTVRSDSSGYITFDNIGSEVDGSNNKAEFYVTTPTEPTSAETEFFD